MADRNKEGKLVCLFCNQTFTNPMEANAHEQNEHDILHIKVEKGELWRLMQLVYKYAPLEPDLISQKLIKRLNKYLRYQKEKITYTDLS